jgi:type I site-specific restriction endonuclease
VIVFDSTNEDISIPVAQLNEIKNPIAEGDMHYVILTVENCAIGVNFLFDKEPALVIMTKEPTSMTNYRQMIGRSVRKNIQKER